MIRNYWLTARGIRVEYSDLEEKHLLNIIKFIEKKSIEGVEICWGSNDVDDPWFDSEELIGDEVKTHYNYKGLLKEALKRKLISTIEYLLKINE